MKKRVMKKIAVAFMATTMTFTAASAITFAETLDESQLDEIEYLDEYDMEEDYYNIQIPGYDTLYFTGNQINQKMIFFNPEENDCYFKGSLVLPDGNVVWTSDLMKPGMVYYEIRLNQILETGVYKDSQLIYDCYSLKDLSLLESAPITVTLIVQ